MYSFGEKDKKIVKLNFILKILMKRKLLSNFQEKQLLH